VGYIASPHQTHQLLYSEWRVVAIVADVIHEINTNSFCHEINCYYRKDSNHNDTGSSLKKTRQEKEMIQGKKQDERAIKERKRGKTFTRLMKLLWF
jgi:hypothetical protein